VRIRQCHRRAHPLASPARASARVTGARIRQRYRRAHPPASPVRNIWFRSLKHLVLRKTRLASKLLWLG
jgi:hypothetical protein